MNEELLLLFERLAWIEAYCSHYEHEEGEVLAALGVDGARLAEARETLIAALHASRSRGDLELSNRFTSEVLRAQTVLVTRRLTLDEVALFVAVLPRDDRVLPDVVLRSAGARD